MANRSGGRSPSRTLVGTLIGIVFFLFVPPAVDHPSETELVVRLLLFSGLGMAAGAVAEARNARRDRDAA